jgi:endonuclease/exonuclease/phosphatase family metal-dependent hydrolase
MERQRLRDRVARRLLGLPGPEEHPSLRHGSSTGLRRGVPFRLACWNLQFGGGRDARFFYDGGTDVSVPSSTVERVLDGIAGVLLTIDADVVLLQEVDRASRRTARIDELEGLLRRVPYPEVASTPYYRVRYVPFPPNEYLGKVSLDLATLSRFELQEAARIPLSPLAEPWWRQQFNLRRAVLSADLPVEGGGRLRILNTHLSAFSRGDGTLARQVAELLAVIDAAEADRVAWVLAGDLNALPPGDDPRRLPDPDEYAESVTPILPLIERFGSPSANWRTYLPPGATEPDRVLDWLFVSAGVTCEGYGAIADGGKWSDHLPIVATLTVG